MNSILFYFKQLLSNIRTCVVIIQKKSLQKGNVTLSHTLSLFHRLIHFRHPCFRFLILFWKKINQGLILRPSMLFKCLFIFYPPVRLEMSFGGCSAVLYSTVHGHQPGCRTAGGTKSACWVGLCATSAVTLRDGLSSAEVLSAGIAPLGFSKTS